MNNGGSTSGTYAQSWLTRFIKKFGRHFKFDSLPENAQRIVTVSCTEHKQHTKTLRACKLLELRLSPCERCSDLIRHQRLADKYFAALTNFHGGRYKYLELIGDKPTWKIKARCEKHGEFVITYRRHRNGGGCEECDWDKQASEAQVEFITSAKEKHGDKYDYSKVDFLNDLYREHRKVTIICLAEGHPDFVQLPADHLAGKGCKLCGNQATIRERTEKRLADGSCLGELYPHLLNEWDCSKNAPEIDPFELPVRSTRYKYWWQCLAGKHKSYLATTEDRTQRNISCPRCSLAQSSKLELYVLSYIEAIYPDVLWRASIEGKEADFYIRSEKVVIEVDGYPWHKDSLEKDIQKRAFFAARGLRTIRLRDSRNPKIDGEVVTIHNKDYYTELPIEELISIIRSPDVFDISLISEEASESYSKRLREYPAPPPDRSLSSLIANLDKVWSDQNDFDPRWIWKGENSVYLFNCESCMHQFKASPKEIGRRYLNHPEVLCGECGQREAIERKAARYLAENSLAKLNPELAKYWSDANKIKPSEVTAKSSKKVLWSCPRGLHKDTERTVSDQFKSTHICKGCYQDTLRSSNPNAKKLFVTELDTGQIICYQQLNDAAERIGTHPSTLSRKIKKAEGQPFDYKGFRITVADPSKP